MSHDDTTNPHAAELRPVLEAIMTQHRSRWGDSDDWDALVDFQRELGKDRKMIGRIAAVRVIGESSVSLDMDAGRDEDIIYAPPFLRSDFKSLVGLILPVPQNR